MCVRKFYYALISCRVQVCTSEYDIPKAARAVMWQKEAIPGVQEAVVMAGQEIHRA